MTQSHATPSYVRILERLKGCETRQAQQHRVALDTRPLQASGHNVMCDCQSPHSELCVAQGHAKAWSNQGLVRIVFVLSDGVALSQLKRALSSRTASSTPSHMPRSQPCGPRAFGRGCSSYHYYPPAGGGALLENALLSGTSPSMPLAWADGRFEVQRQPLYTIRGTLCQLNSRLPLILSDSCKIYFMRPVGQYTRSNAAVLQGGCCTDSNCNPVSFPCRRPLQLVTRQRERLCHCRRRQPRGGVPLPAGARRL